MARDKESISSVILWISIRLLINVLLLFVLVEGFSSAYSFSYKLFSDVPYQAAVSNETAVTIEQGTGVMDLAVLLEESGIVENRYIFLGRVYLGKYDTRIIAGTYSLAPNMSPDEICQKICGIQSEEVS